MRKILLTRAKHYLLTTLWVSLGLLPALSPQVSAQTQTSARISVHFQDETLEKAITRLRQLGNVTIAYNKAELSPYVTGTQQFGNATIEEILRQLLVHTPLSVERKGSAYVIVRPKTSATLTAPAPKTTTGLIKGQITDAQTGDVLPGATALVQETGQGAAADYAGFYRINRLAEGSYTLEFSFVGYTKRVIQGVQVQADQTLTLDVQLAPEGNLSEVVVEGMRDRNVP
ncbi:MAG: hypothetical protein HC880_12890, partial [Bacteroidia bacterium]|nr:hypothetical protein [Bacteroidia bacterium]